MSSPETTVARSSNVDGEALLQNIFVDRFVNERKPRTLIRLCTDPVPNPYLTTDVKPDDTWERGYAHPCSALWT